MSVRLPVTERQTDKPLLPEAAVAVDLEDVYAPDAPPLASCIKDEKGLTIEIFRNSLKEAKRTLQERRVTIINEEVFRNGSWGDDIENRDLKDRGRTVGWSIGIFFVAGLISALVAGLVIGNKDSDEWNSYYPNGTKGWTIFGSTAGGSILFASISLFLLNYYILRQLQDRKTRKIETIDDRIANINHILERLQFNQPQRNSAPSELVLPFIPEMRNHDIKRLNYVQLKQAEDENPGIVKNWLDASLLSRKQTFIWNKIFQLQDKSVEDVIVIIERKVFQDHIKEHPILFTGIVQNLPKDYLHRPKLLHVLVQIYQDHILNEHVKTPSDLHATIHKLADTSNFETLQPQPEKNMIIRACSSSSSSAAEVNRDRLLAESGYFKRTLEGGKPTNEYSLKEAVPDDIFKSITNFTQGGTIDFDSHPIRTWLQYAKLFEVQKLTTLCQQYLLETIGDYKTETLIEIYNDDRFDNLKKVLCERIFIAIRSYSPDSTEFADAFSQAERCGLDEITRTAKELLGDFTRSWDVSITVPTYIERLSQMLQLNDQYALDFRDQLAGKISSQLLSNPEGLEPFWNSLDLQQRDHSETVTWVRSVVVKIYIENKETVDEACPAIPDNLYAAAQRAAAEEMA